MTGNSFLQTILIMEIHLCTKEDFNQIYTDITDFWGSDRTLHLHHPSLIYEFGNTSFVIREENIVLAYIFSYLSQTESLIYVHLLGVREAYQKRGLGTALYEQVTKLARANNIKKIKAITTPDNFKSIAFHTKMGMKMLGEPDENGINIIHEYSGPGLDRVVFEKEL